MPDHPQVCGPGEFPTRYLDQALAFVDLTGHEWRLADMGEQFTLWALDFLLANAAQIRKAWSIEHKATYDVEIKARRWMLDRPLVRALMGLLGQRRDDRADYYAVILREIAEAGDGWEVRAAQEALEGSSEPSSGDAKLRAALRRIADGRTPEEVFASSLGDVDWAARIATEALR